MIPRRRTAAPAFVDRVADSVGQDRFAKVDRIHAFELAKTLGQLDRATLTPAAFVEHIEQAEQVHYRFYPEISAVNFRTYLLPIRIRSENCTSAGWRKSLRNMVEPQIAGLTTPAPVALKVLAWCKSNIQLTDDDRCYRLGLKGDLDPLSTLRGGVGSEVDLSILAVAALRSVGVAARLITAPMIAGEAGGKVWIEYRTEKGWNAWIPGAPAGIDAKQYLLREFGNRFALILANPEEPINITSTYIPVAHIEVTLNNMQLNQKPGWNLLLRSKSQLSPITGKNIYIRMSDTLDVGPGDYIIVAGDRTVGGIKPISIQAGESGSYVLDPTQKGIQTFNIDDASNASAPSVAVTMLNTAIAHDPALW
jgi:hypothetical protein